MERTIPRHSTIARGKLMGIVPSQPMIAGGYGLGHLMASRESHCGKVGSSSQRLSIFSDPVDKSSTDDDVYASWFQEA